MTGAPGACCLCGATKLAAEWTGPDTDGLLQRTFTLYRCGTCGVGQVAPLPTAEEEGQLYPPVFYRKSARPEHPGLLSRLVTAWERLGYQQRVSLVGAPSGTRKLLDVGCGNGRFLSEARAAGWEVEGVEPSDSGAELAARQYDVKVHHGRLDRLALAEGSYQAITFWHTIEHMADFRVVLATAVKLLAPGGSLVLATPDFGGFEARLFGSKWGLFDVPRHVVLFTADSLRKLADELGLKVESAHHFSIEFDAPIAVQNVLNVICTESMFLYKIAKREVDRSRCQKPADYPYNIAATVLGAALLGPYAVVFGLLFSALKSGTTITLRCSRR